MCSIMLLELLIEIGQLLELLVLKLQAGSAQEESENRLQGDSHSSRGAGTDEGIHLFEEIY